MRRIGLLLLLLGLLCAVLPGQTRQATVQLHDGREVTGVVVRIDADVLVLRVGDDIQQYSPEQIRDCEFTPLQPPAAPGAETVPAVPEVEDAASPAPAGEPGAGDAGAVGGSTAAEVDAAGPTPRGAAADDPAAAARGHHARPRWARRLEALDMRFPWLFPTEPLQWLSLGVMLFALLSLAVHFAAKLAATDQLQFGRAALVAMCLLVVGAAQAALLPSTPTALAAAAIGDVLFALLWFGLAYELGITAGIVALLLLAIQGGIGYALLLLVDATLRSIGNTTF